MRMLDLGLQLHFLRCISCYPAMVAITGDGCLFVMAAVCVFQTLCVDKNKLLQSLMLFKHAFLMKASIIMPSLLTLIVFPPDL